MYAHSSEGQPCPGLHQEMHGQQVKGGDSAPLLHSGESPPGVLRPALELSAQERHGPVGVGPEEATKMVGGLEHLSYEERLRVGAVQPGGEKAPGRPYCSLPVPGGACKKAGEGLFTRAHSDRTRGNGLKLKESRFRLKKEILYDEGGEALAQVAQRSCGCPLPGSVQGQLGQGFEQPGLVEGVPAHGRGVGTR